MDSGYHLEQEKELKKEAGKWSRKSPFEYSGYGNTLEIRKVE